MTEAEISKARLKKIQIECRYCHANFNSLESAIKHLENEERSFVGINLDDKNGLGKYWISWRGRSVFD